MKSQITCLPVLGLVPLGRKNIATTRPSSYGRKLCVTRPSSACRIPTLNKSLTLIPSKCKGSRQGRRKPQPRKLLRLNANGKKTACDGNKLPNSGEPVSTTTIFPTTCRQCSVLKATKL